MRHKLYVAASSDQWDRAKILAELVAIELGDAEVVSRWHNTAIEKYPAREDVRAVQIAMNCAGLDKATVVIALCDAGEPRTTFADVGYAIGRGVPVVWVKGRLAHQQCLFDAHPRVCLVERMGTSIKTLAAQIAIHIENDLTEVA